MNWLFHWLHYRQLMVCLLLFITTHIYAATTPVVKPDLATIGIYMVSVHDLNFSTNAFGADLWVWANYENARIQPIKTMELINAKSALTSLQNTDHKGHYIWSQQKIQGTFRHSWDMTNFPFDRHTLTIILEETLDTMDRLHYVVDTKNNGYAKDIDIDGFAIRNMSVESVHSDYDTNFGDPNAPPTSSYTQLRINLELERVSRVLFFKLHTALYAAFLVSAFCIPLLTQIIKTPQIIGSILSAIVGSLFASIINLRTADSVIGRSEALTLVDRLHFLTLAYFIVLGTLAVAVLVTRDQWQSDNIYRFSRLSGRIYVISYIACNIFLIWWAAA